MNGLINLLKPPGMTSHDAVNRVRKTMGIKRVGHAGTLDPEAAGVLPVCIGSATRLIQYMDHREKIYRAEMKLGVATDTQDMTGRILAVCDTIPEQTLVQKAIMSYIGEYNQIPPMFSSAKKNGKRLYQLAREGEVIQREPKKRWIHWIAIIRHDHSVLFDVACSEGTYIRTLCHDIGDDLGCGAAMSFLLRKESCRLSLFEAVTIEELEEHKNPGELLMAADKAVEHLPELHIKEQYSHRVRNGNPIPLEGIKTSDGKAVQAGFCEDGFFRLYTSSCFQGIGRISRDRNLLLFVMKYTAA